MEEGDERRTITTLRINVLPGGTTTITTTTSSLFTASHLRYTLQTYSWPGHSQTSRWERTRHASLGGDRPEDTKRIAMRYRSSGGGGRGGGGPGGRVSVEVGASVVEVLGQVGEGFAADLTLV